MGGGKGLARAAASVGTQRRLPRRRDRGFSLLVVFMLIMVMVGAAAAVMLATQQDLSVSGQDREQLQAFYAAEYAVAQAKDWLAVNNATAYQNGSWTTFLTAAGPFVCSYQPAPPTPPRGPETSPNDSTNPWTEFPGPPEATTRPFYVGGGESGAAKVQYRFCFHNDPEDFNFANFNGGLDGNANDDSSNLLTIEGYGQVLPSTGSNPTALASARVWVVIGRPIGATPVLPNGYRQEGGGGGGHTANAGAEEAGTTILNPSGTTTVRGL